MNSIHLDGASDVRSAGTSISYAADRISSAASTIDDASRRMADVMYNATQAMNRLAEALERAAVPAEPETPDEPEPAPWACQRGYGSDCADASLCEERGTCSLPAVEPSQPAGVWTCHHAPCRTMDACGRAGQCLDSGFSNTGKRIL